MAGMIFSVAARHGRMNVVEALWYSVTERKGGTESEN